MKAQEPGLLVAEAGRMIRNLHVAKNDPDKDVAYWADFAKGMSRHEAESIGLAGDFDQAYESSDLLRLQQIARRVTIDKLLKKTNASGRYLSGAGSRRP